MTVHSRLRKLRQLAVSTKAGAEPTVMEIDDCSESVGDWPEIEDSCPNNRATGQHEYSRDYYDFGRCIHCHEPSGLDR